MQSSFEEIQYGIFSVFVFVGVAVIFQTITTFEIDKLFSGDTLPSFIETQRCK